MISYSEYSKNYVGEPVFLIKRDNLFSEYADSTRYSVEVNYRTTPDQALEAYSKIVLGYVSAGIKQHNYHVKHVYTEKPLRILISSRNWDDGEWVVVVSWHPKEKCFYVSRGFYNKDRRTVSVQGETNKSEGESAFEITKQVYNLLHKLKDVPDNVKEKLKPVLLKRGPKS